MLALGAEFTSDGGANPRFGSVMSLCADTHIPYFVSTPFSTLDALVTISSMGEFRPAHVMNIPKVLFELVTASCYRHSVTRSR